MPAETEAFSRFRPSHGEISSPSAFGFQKRGWGDVQLFVVEWRFFVEYRYFFAGSGHYSKCGHFLCSMDTFCGVWTLDISADCSHHSNCVICCEVGTFFAGCGYFGKRGYFLWSVDMFCRVWSVVTMVSVDIFRGCGHFFEGVATTLSVDFGHSL